MSQNRIGRISSSTNPLNAREYSQIAANLRHFNCTVPLGPPGKYEEIIVATPVFLPSNEHIFFDRQLHIRSIPSSKDIERQHVLCTVPCRHALDHFDSPHSLQQAPQQIPSRRDVLPRISYDIAYLLAPLVYLV